MSNDIIYGRLASMVNSATVTANSDSASIYSSLLKSANIGLKVSTTTSDSYPLKSIVKLGLEATCTKFEVTKSLKLKYSNTFNLENNNIEKDAELLSKCQINSESISIQQMMDVLTDEYDEQKTYEEPDIETFNQKASEIDITNKLDEAIIKLDDLLIEARHFKNNVKSNETVKNTFLRIICEALCAEMVVLAFKLLLIFLDYTFTNIEVIHDFLLNLLSLL